MKRSFVYGCGTILVLLLVTCGLFMGGYLHKAPEPIGGLSRVFSPTSRGLFASLYGGELNIAEKGSSLSGTITHEYNGNYNFYLYPADHVSREDFGPIHLATIASSDWTTPLKISLTFRHNGEIIQEYVVGGKDLSATSMRLIIKVYKCPRDVPRNDPIDFTATVIRPDAELGEQMGPWRLVCRKFSDH